VFVVLRCALLYQRKIFKISESWLAPFFMCRYIQISKWCYVFVAFMVYHVDLVSDDSRFFPVLDGLLHFGIYVR
jgi:hypothetical protein